MPREELRVARSALRRWLIQPDLAPLRDEEALADLPEGERETWRAFWRNVRAAIQETWERN
jgi:hypothetical protein